MELEKRGFECLAPIKEVFKHGKSWINVKEHGRKKSIFNGNQQEIYYITIMGRVVDESSTL